MQRYVIRWIAIMLVLGGLGACHRTQLSFPNDAYIWQRVWTPALTEAVKISAPDIRAWRVLAAQTDHAGRLQAFHPNLATLLASDKPMVLVVRIDGQLAAWDEASLLADAAALWRGWQHSGLRIVGLEIDHDCGTARLPAYAHFLAKLRPVLQGTSLSITALPAWLHSTDLAAVLAEVDESVLQVHAVRDPRAGLFDATLALRWVNEYAGKSAKSFRVALPTYASRVSWDAQGRLASVQSEIGALDAGDESRELLAMPQVIADFLHALDADPPAHLAGIVWFRLPTAQDRRAWSLPTWRAVMRRQPVNGRVTAMTRASTVAGTRDLLLQNSTALDLPLPVRVLLPPGCSLADGINGYALDANHKILSLVRGQPGLLHGQSLRVVGWARCNTQVGELHVEL